MGALFDSLAQRVSRSAAMTVVTASQSDNQEPSGPLLVISTHGYVAATPELGRADTWPARWFTYSNWPKNSRSWGWEVDIATRQFADQAHEEPVCDRVRILRFPCGGQEFIPKEQLWTFLPGMGRASCRFRRAHRRRYCCVSTHYWDAGYAGRAIATQLNAPHVHTPHSLGTWKQSQMNDDARAEDSQCFVDRIREENEIYRAADCLVATTRQQEQILAQDYQVPPEKIAILPPGYDESRFHPVSPSSGMRPESGWDGMPERSWLSAGWPTIRDTTCCSAPCRPFSIHSPKCASCWRLDRQISPPRNRRPENG